jgi:hypothetical protein
MSYNLRSRRGEEGTGNQEAATIWQLVDLQSSLQEALQVHSEMWDQRFFEIESKFDKVMALMVQKLGPIESNSSIEESVNQETNEAEVKTSAGLEAEVRRRISSVTGTPVSTSRIPELLIHNRESSSENHLSSTLMKQMKSMLVKEPTLQCLEKVTYHDFKLEFDVYQLKGGLIPMHLCISNDLLQIIAVRARVSMKQIGSSTTPELHRWAVCGEAADG